MNESCVKATEHPDLREGLTLWLFFLCTHCPRKPLVLGDICDVQRLHSVLNILSVHVVNLVDVTFPAEAKMFQLGFM